MSNVFFWIIILSFLIPFAMRMYRKRVGRNQNQDFNGQYPGQFPGQQPGRPNNQPRDGYTQQDYFGGGFRQLGGGQQPPLDQPYQNPGYQNPGYQNPGYPAPVTRTRAIPDRCRTRTVPSIPPTSHASSRSSRLPRSLPRRRRPLRVSVHGNWRS